MQSAPSNTAPPSEPRIPSAREGLIDRAQLAGPDQLDCSERTIIRYERAGMPFISLGMKRFYDPVRVRAWLLSHEHRQDAPRRGRPPGRRAA